MTNLTTCTIASDIACKVDTTDQGLDDVENCSVLHCESPNEDHFPQPDSLTRADVDETIKLNCAQLIEIKFIFFFISSNCIVNFSLASSSRFFFGVSSFENDQNYSLSL